LDGGVKQFPLRPPVRPWGGPPKGRIEKGRLVDVFGPVGNEADPHLASRNFGSKLLRQEVGRDGASHTPADDDNLVHGAYPPLTLTASLAGPTGDDASRGRFLLPEFYRRPKAAVIEPFPPQNAWLPRLPQWPRACALPFQPTPEYRLWIPGLSKGQRPPGPFPPP